MVSGFDKFFVAAPQSRGEIRHLVDDISHEIRGGIANFRSQRIQIQKTEVFQNILQERPECRTESNPWPVCGLDLPQHFIAKRKFAQALPKFRDGDLAQFDISDRTAVRNRIRDRNFGGPRLRIEHPGVIHFRQVVIFGREPKNRNRGYALLLQMLRQFHRRQSFKDRVRRSREQTHLLAGHHRDRARLGQLRQCRGVSVLLAQSADYTLAPRVGIRKPLYRRA